MVLIFHFTKCYIIKGKVLDGTCVYGKYDGTIASEKFNETSQICTISGIHEKYNGGLEIRCCGSKYHKLE